MKLFAGLGNPGPEYALNRHNVGFMAVDAIAAAHGFSAWRNRFSGLAAEGRLGSEQVLLLKPQTYMNRSGNSVGEAARFYKLELENVVIFHDELDLPLGKLRVKTGGGVAGHNGLKSISAHIGNDYVRARVGIGHPGQREKVAKYVLSDFPKAERPLLEAMLGAIADAAPLLTEETPAKFQTRVAHLTQAAAEALPQAAAASSRVTGSTATEGLAGKLRRWFGA
jgi:peptidyl-tRNA hydrolase, PTH1 family